VAPPPVSTRGSICAFSAVEPVGSFMGTMGELHQVLKFVFRKQLKPVVDRISRWRKRRGPSLFGEQGTVRQGRRQTLRREMVALA
jgi:hypothetical protein